MTEQAPSNTQTTTPAAAPAAPAFDPVAAYAEAKALTTGDVTASPEAKQPSSADTAATAAPAQGSTPGPAAAQTPAAGADTAAGKTVTPSAPKNAAIEIDWTKVNPKLKVAYDAAPDDEARAAIEETLRTNISRGQEIAKLRQSRSPKAPSTTPGSTTGGKSAAPAAVSKVREALDSNELKELAKDVPEMAPVVKLMGQITDTLTVVSAEVERGAQAAERLQAQDAELAYQEQVTILSEKHADWETIGDSDPFHAWLATASDNAKQVVAANSGPAGIVNGKAVSEVLDLFKLHTGLATPSTPPGGQNPQGIQQPSPVSAKRERQLESLQTPRFKSVGPVTGPDPNDQVSAYHEWKRLNMPSNQSRL